MILWGIGSMPLRKKLLLGGIFCLTLLTIAVTIIRGVLQAGSVEGEYRPFGSGTRLPQPNQTWCWFWSFVEFVTGQ